MAENFTKYGNKSVYPNEGKTIKILRTPNANAETVEVRTGYIGRTSGVYYKINGIVYFLVNISTPKNANLSYGYVDANNVHFEEPNSNEAAQYVQELINTYIKQEQGIYKKLLFLAPIIKKMRDDKVQGYQNYLAAYKLLLERLYLRQETFINSQLVNVQTAQLKGGEKEKEELKTLWAAISGIGVIPVIVYLVAAAIVAGGTAAICYYAFKPNYEESKVDFKLSKELDDTLRAKLTPAEYAQLNKEGKENLNTAYSYGKGEGKVNLVTKVLLFIGAFYTVDKYVLKTKRG